MTATRTAGAGSATPPPPALGLRALLRAVGMHPEDPAAERFDLAGRRALCIATNHGELTPGTRTGVFCSELSVPYYAFLDAGMEVEVASPAGGLILADLGADVVKVERPGAGDDTRHWGPPFLKDADGNDTTEATYFTACNRNKRSVTIDMAKPEGQALIRHMAANSDVLVENFKTGTLEKWGLGYASLAARFPRLVHCRISGFGADGPCFDPFGGRSIPPIIVHRPRAF